MDKKPKIQNESLSTCTMIFQLFGLQYFSLSSKNFLLPTSKLLLHKIIFGGMMTYLLMEIIGIIVVINVEQKFIQEQKQNNTKAQNGFHFQYGSYFFMNFVVLVSTLHAWFNAVKSMKIFNQLEKILKIFENETGCAPKYEVFIKRFTSVVWIFVTVFGLSTVVTLGFVYYHSRSTMFYWALLVVLPYLFIGVSYLKYSFFIEVINVNLQTIHEVLNRAYDLKQIIKVEEVHEINATLSITQEPENETIFETAVVLKRIYGLLYEVGIWVNEICGVSAILQLITIIVSNTSAGYKFFLVSSGILPVGRVGVAVYTMILTYAVLAMMLIYACSCYETSHSILILLHKFEFDQHERRKQYAVSDIIQEFTAQIIQHPIRFTFCGYFGIEKSFLAQIVLTILTYQIILAQFQ